jgi:hypothetical protein
MESCRPAIIVSLGVTAHWLPQKGGREAGIDSVAEFLWFGAAWSSTIRNTSLGPCSTGIPACVFQGLGDGDFHFLTTRRSRSVSKLALIRGGRNLGLNVIFRGAG